MTDTYAPGEPDLTGYLSFSAADLPQNPTPFERLIYAIRLMHDQVNLTDPHDPVGVALTMAGLAVRP